MANDDPFNFDLRVSTDKKKRRGGRRGMSGAFETSQRVCEHPGCDKPGQYRAPKAPDVLDDYYWFCREHVREYNLKWNFFEGTTEAEMEAQMDRARVWDRPTKDFKKSAEERAWSRLGVDDPHQVLGENATRNPGKSSPTGGRRLPPTERRAHRDPGGQGSLDQGGGAQGLQGADQGAAPGHERRRPQPGGTTATGGLGLGPDQGQPHTSSKPLPNL